MNKELIIKYNEEFNHWIEGGTLQCIFHNDTKPYWEVCTDDELNRIFGNNGANLEISIVINDAYAELRKAIAEGKIVQYRTIEVLEFGGEREVWRDINPANISQYHISVLRIKSDGTQLKVGDWCLDTRDNQLKQVVNPESPVICAYYTLWQPQPNEWCVFWETDVTAYTVARFHSRSKRGAYVTNYGHEFYNIAPLEFIQTLKDSHEHANTNVTGTTI